MLRRWCVPLAGIALVIGSTAATAPAVAAGHAPLAAAAGHLVRPTIHLIRPAGPRPMISQGGPRNAVESLNWSGYAAHGRTFKSVSAHWTEPMGHCGSKRKFSSFWVGIDGFSSGTVEQTGTDVDCRHGHARYFGWYEMFPAPPVNFSNPVHPGDHFKASVTHAGANHYTLVLKDTTRGWSHTVHKSIRGAKNSSAEIIAEAPSSGGTILPLTNFGTVHFSKSHANGLAIGHFHPVEIVMVNKNGRHKVSVSSLSSGQSFSVHWLHST